MDESKVVDIFSRKNKKKSSDEEDKKSTDFEEIQKINALKEEKRVRERQQHNRKVKTEYRLTPKK